MAAILFGFRMVDHSKSERQNGRLSLGRFIYKNIVPKSVPCLVVKVIYFAVLISGVLTGLCLYITPLSLCCVTLGKVRVVLIKYRTANLLPRAEGKNSITCFACFFQFQP